MVGPPLGSQAVLTEAEKFLKENSDVGGDIFKMKLQQQTDNSIARKLLEDANAIAEGHFVYKSGKHGPLYINKEVFADFDVKMFWFLLKTIANNAVILDGMTFEPGKVVRVFGPAYGAIVYSMPVAYALAQLFPETTFKIARTELDENKKHFIPDKLIESYRDADIFICTEDIVNSGTTIRELGRLIEATYEKKLTKAISIANRGGQNAESLLLEQYSTLIDKKFDQWDPRIPAELALINALGEINLKLGKGKIWTGLFGPGPYAEDSDFSAFPFEWWREDMTNDIETGKGRPRGRPRNQNDSLEVHYYNYKDQPSVFIRIKEAASYFFCSFNSAAQRLLRLGLLIEEARKNDSEIIIRKNNESDKRIIIM